VGSLRLYLRYVATSVRAQLQYRASAIMLSVGQLLLTAIEFVAVWALFDRFGHLEGWTLPQVALLYGMANVAFGLAEIVARGFDLFPRLVKSGDFDRVLLRPRSTALQVAASDVYVFRIGRLVQGLGVLVWASWSLQVAWSVPKLLLLVFSILSGAATFTGLLVLQATLAFWTTEGLEVANTLTYGGVETTQYPLSIYRTWLRRLFTFVVPLACMNYFPSLAITGHAEAASYPAWLPWSAPAVGFAFLVVALRVWEFGVRHYRSTGN